MILAYNFLKIFLKKLTKENWKSRSRNFFMKMFMLIWQTVKVFLLFTLTTKLSSADLKIKDLFILIYRYI